MSLLAPVFMVGLLAIALPWWLHRLSRDNPPLHDFGSSMFLQTGETTSSKQTQLRYKKLFLLRFLLLLLLALLFAEPAFQLNKIMGRSDYRRIMVVDTSLSQRLGDRWAKTLEQLHQQLDNASIADEIFIVSASHLFQQLEGDNSIADARDQLAKLKPGLTRLNYGQLAPSIADLVNQSSLPVVVHLFTDTQATAMPARFSDLTFDGIERFIIHSTATDGDANLAITGQLNHSADGKINLSTILSNYGNVSTNATVQLIASNSTLDAVNLAVAGNSSAAHQFTEIDSTKVKHAIEVRIAASTSQTDQLADDNSWLIALPDGTRTEVSLLQSNAIANRYTAAAIDSDPRYTTRVLEGENLSAASAGGLLIIADASALTDRSTLKLKQYLNDGGNALVIVGAEPHALQMRSLLNVRSESLNQATTDSSTDAISPIGLQRISYIDDTHAMTADTSNNWRSISVLQRLPLTINEGDRVIAELTDGSPLLIERRIGEGRVLVFASALVSSWNNLAVNPLFVAFIVSAIEDLTGVDSTSLNRSVGEFITLLPGAQLLSPEGEPIRDLSDLKRKGRIMLSERGIYTVRSTTGAELLTVNTDNRESDTRSIDRDVLAQWQTNGFGNTTVAVSSENQTDTKAENVGLSAESVQQSSQQSAAQPTAPPSVLAQTNQHTKSLWPWLLTMMLILALLETLYSHRHLRIKREA